jgi:GntR family transcriptional regulator
VTVSKASPEQPSAPRTKHAAITARLREELRNEPTGTRLPPERDMAERFGVSRMTVRQALDQLEAEGRLERVRGSGTFTRRPTVAMGPTLTSFTEDMRCRDLVPSSRLLGFTRVVPEPLIRQALELSPGEEVVWMERLRFADGEPICIEVAQFPARLQRLLEGVDLEQSLHAALIAGGVVPSSVVRNVRAVVAEPRETRFLALPPGAPALEVLDVFADTSGRPIQHARSRYRFDRYEVQMTANRLNAR